MGPEKGAVGADPDSILDTNYFELALVLWTELLTGFRGLLLDLLLSDFLLFKRLFLLLNLPFKGFNLLFLPIFLFLCLLPARLVC